jgi:hypothetical protein
VPLGNTVAVARKLRQVGLDRRALLQRRIAPGGQTKYFASGNNWQAGKKPGYPRPRIQPHALD